MIFCELCQREVLDVKQAYRRVEGWERPGKGANNQSGSSIVDRKVSKDIVAHAECITRMVSGLSVGQESLL